MRENLYLRKLFSELEFLTVDADFKGQMFEKYKMDFNNKIVEFLNDNPEIKKEYDKINGPQFTEDDMNHTPKEKTEQEIEDFENKKKEIEEALKEEEYADNLEKRVFTEDPDIKRIYRSIVKLTHPDKIKLENKNRQTILKKYYLEATDSYNKQNLYEIVRIATLLNVDIGDLSDENLDRLEECLKILKKDIKVIESTLPWKYFEELRDDIQRKILIKQFILTYINHNQGVNNTPKKYS